MAMRNSYNPTTEVYYGLCHGYAPDPGDYRRSLWEKVDLPDGPTTWEELLAGGGRIKAEQGIQMGIGMSNEIDSKMAAQTLMWANGARDPGRERERHDQLAGDDRRRRVHGPALQDGHDAGGLRLERGQQQPAPGRRQGLLHPQLDLGLPHGAEGPAGGRRGHLLPHAAHSARPGRRRRWPTATPSSSR